MSPAPCQSAVNAHWRGFESRLLLVIDRPGQARWRLAEPLRYQAAPGLVVEVPAGLATDLASVPRLLRPLALADPLTAWAAVVHDWLYHSQQLDRPAADALFYGALLDSGVPRFWAVVYYAAVRVGGWLTWYRRTPAKDGPPCD